jgi:hypothetical protein
MDEATVFIRLARWLEQQDNRFFVHVPPKDRDDGDYRTVVSQYQTHEIGIGGYKPDILGFTPANRIFAVEVKGDSSLRKGLGQAASYQRGVNHAYLAADAGSLNRIKDVVLSKGIGMYGVDADEIDAIHPTAVDLRDQLDNTRQQLNGLLTNPGRGQQQLPRYADPLNNLMPLLAVAYHDCSTKSAVSDLCEDVEYPYVSVANRMVELAQSLGLITDTTGSLEVTAQGQLGLAVLRSNGADSVQELMKLKHGGALAEKEPALAVFLRNRFAGIPEYRTLFEILLRHDSDRISIRQLCERVIDNYPSTFLNLIYTSRTDDRNAAKLIETGRGNKIYGDPDYLANIIHSQFISNTVSQFRSLGVLTGATSPIEPKSALDPERDYWYPDSFSIS